MDRTFRELSASRARTLAPLSPAHVPRGRRRIPVYDLKVAAGAFSDGQNPNLLGHLALDIGARSDAGLFVARVLGDSMNQVAPDGSWCLWENLRGAGVAPPRRGERVLVRLENTIDPDLGQFTFKHWVRVPGVLLEPRSRNKAHKAIRLSADDEPEILARFLRVLDDDDVLGK